MYSKPFYITDEIGNNAFSFDKRENKQLYVPSLKKIQSLDEIALISPFVKGVPEGGGIHADSKVAFEDFNIYDESKLDTCYWLENFYEIERPHPNPLLAGEGKTQTIYLFDNHNHAYFFWYLARDKWYIKDGAKLYHIDEHSDMRDIEGWLLKPDSQDLEKVFQATNFSDINVGNYILPAQREGIIWEIVQIRNEDNLLEYLKDHPPTPSLTRRGRTTQESGVVLNLDLDFFQPDLDFIDYDLKKQVTLDAARRADVITVATSPFFIDQKLALDVFKDLFDK